MNEVNYSVYKIFQVKMKNYKIKAI